jgi:hypothetical protein
MDIVDVFNRSNMSDEINTKLVYDILNIYNNSNAIDYIKMMAGLLKDIRSILSYNKNIIRPMRLWRLNAQVL